jgi:hypothetical protein
MGATLNICVTESYLGEDIVRHILNRPVFVRSNINNNFLQVHMHNILLYILRILRCSVANLL